jgi:hypothetical protein
MLLLWALVAVASATAVSKNIYVDSASGADDQNCLSMAAACKTLQRAFDIVNPTGGRSAGVFADVSPAKNQMSSSARAPSRHRICR